MINSPLEPPFDGEAAKTFAANVISAQENALETVAVPLFAALQTAIDAQETLISSVVKPLVKHAKKLVKEQQRQLDSVSDVLLLHGRTSIATQAAQLGGVDTQSGGGRYGYEVEDGNPPPIPPPIPPGGSNYCFVGFRDDVQSRPDCFAVYRQQDGEPNPPVGWRRIGSDCGYDSQSSAARAAEALGYRDCRDIIPPPPPENWCLVGFVNDFTGLTCYAVYRNNEYPPDPPPDYRWNWTQCDYRTREIAEEAGSRYTHGPCNVVPPPPGEIPPPVPGEIPPSGEIPGQPPIVPPPPPPPPPPQPPIDDFRPIDQTPLPPPAEDCPPTDPCFPRGLSLVNRETYSATPRPLPYWARARCVGTCSAVIECYQGDCPPAYDPAWMTFGYYDHCPTDWEKELIVRHCLGGNGGGGTIIEPPQPIDMPDWVNPPPPPEPPKQDPIPPGECPQPKPVRPDLVLDEYVPVCRTYEEWGGSVIRNLSTFSSIDEVQAWLEEQQTFELDMPEFLRG